MSQPATHVSSNGHARGIDWSGYPSLFERVGGPHQLREPATQTASEIRPVTTEPAPVIGHSGGVREAFLGYCQAALFAQGTFARPDLPSEQWSAVRVLAAAEHFGFTREEIRNLGCGLYPGPAAVRDHLTGVGFGEAEIDAAGLVTDSQSKPRAACIGCLVVPLTDEAGLLRNFLCVTVTPEGRFGASQLLYGTAVSQLLAYGLQSALPRDQRCHLVLVEGILEALLLQRRGLPQVAAIGGNGESFSPSRWEGIAKLGVAAVTLALRRDEHHSATVREALVHALRAKAAPEVYVANPYPAGEQTAVDVLRRLGRGACEVAVTARTLAFHDKDLGAFERTKSTPIPPPAAVAQVVQAPKSESRNEAERFAMPRFEMPPMPTPASVPVAPTEPHHRAAFRQHALELIAGLPTEERGWYDQLIGLFDAEVRNEDYVRAEQLAAWPFAGSAGHGMFSHLNPAAFGFSVPQLETRHARPATTSTAAELLSELRSGSPHRELPGHMAQLGPQEAPRAIEWLIDPSARGRLWLLCDRLLSAIERHPQQSFVIACCEHTDREFLLTLTTLLAGRLSESTGLPIEEVRTRLEGSETTGGYSDKPWLVDEAADRLRLCAERLYFVSCPPTPGGAEELRRGIARAQQNAPLGGIYCDAFPTCGFDAGWTSLGLPNWMTDHGSRVVIALGHPPVAQQFAQGLFMPGFAAHTWPANFAMPMWTSLPGAYGRHADRIQTVLRNWLARERETI